MVKKQQNVAEVPTSFIQPAEIGAHKQKLEDAIKELVNSFQETTKLIVDFVEVYKNPDNSVHDIRLRLKR